jgi:ethanolamine ammonia-lyase large subunit
MFKYTVQNRCYYFKNLAELLAKSSPARSGDFLAQLAASSAQERIAAQIVLADLPLSYFLSHFVIPYEEDDVTRLIVDSHDSVAFNEISHLTVGGLRNYLLSYEIQKNELQKIAKGLTPEMVAAVSKIMSQQDLILVASKCEVITQFRTTVGLKGRLSTRLQPNHPTDEFSGIMASLIDGLMLGSGDAVVGINPASDDVQTQIKLLNMIEELRIKYDIPIQSCVLSHVTNTILAIEQGAPVDLVFQSIAGTQKANSSFGVQLSLLKEAHQAAQELNRGTVGQQVMYFETGQGSALSAQAHFGVDQQTLEVRAYAVAREFDPFLVNSVVGFIGPEYLYNGKQIIRAGLEDHFCAKLLGLPMGCDVCYTNHANADADDMDSLMTLLGTAGCSYIMGVPGSDDIMLNYQSTSFHDALYLRQLLNLKPAPEFENWLNQVGLMGENLQINNTQHLPFQIEEFQKSIFARGDL